MRRTALFYILILTLPLFSTLYAQPDTLWTKAIGGELTDVFYSIEPRAGGGYIVGGYTESNADTLRNYWLARLNSAGDDTVVVRSSLVPVIPGSSRPMAMEHFCGKRVKATSLAVYSGSRRLPTTA
jgi:hypothetical protein